MVLAEVSLPLDACTDIWTQWGSMDLREITHCFIGLVVGYLGRQNNQ